MEVRIILPLIFFTEGLLTPASLSDVYEVGMLARDCDRKSSRELAPALQINLGRAKHVSFSRHGEFSQYVEENYNELMCRCDGYDM